MAACNVCGSTRSTKAEGLPVVCANGAKCAARADSLDAAKADPLREPRHGGFAVDCPDGGRCHHQCATSSSCFRVRECAPLSGVYPNDEWPESVVVVTIVDVPPVLPRLSFRALETSRLVQIDLNDPRSYADAEIAGAFVKATAELRPSEREAFDGQALKDKLRGLGARAVLLAVVPVGEAPDKEAKADVVAAVRPDEAIAAWFDGLNNVPVDDREAAKALALAILAAEGL